MKTTTMTSSISRPVTELEYSPTGIYRMACTVNCMPRQPMAILRTGRMAHLSKCRPDT